MGEIDWDDAIYEAENSPRAVLAGFLENAGKYRSIVIAAVSREAVDEEHFEWDSSGSPFECIGLLEATLDDVRAHVRKGRD